MADQESRAGTALTTRLMVVNVPASDIAPEVEKVPGTGPSGFEAAIVTLSGGDACAAGTNVTANTDKPRTKANRNSRYERISPPVLDHAHHGRD